jgi:hypothetical protein
MAAASLKEAGGLRVRMFGDEGDLWASATLRQPDSREPISRENPIALCWGALHPPRQCERESDVAGRARMRGEKRKDGRVGQMDRHVKSGAGPTAIFGCCVLGSGFSHG